jgi:hypothetical protein
MITLKKILTSLIVVSIAFTVVSCGSTKCSEIHGAFVCADNLRQVR